MNTQGELKSYDTITLHNMEEVAKKMLECPNHYGKDKVSLEDRIRVLILLSTKWSHNERGYTQYSYPVWHMVGSVNQNWYKFADYLRGRRFAMCLEKALDLFDSGVSSHVPSWREIEEDKEKDGAEFIIAKTCSSILNHYDEINEEAGIILSLPPVVIVAMHIWARDKMESALGDDINSVYEGDLTELAKEIRRVYPLVLREFIKQYPKIRESVGGMPI